MNHSSHANDNKRGTIMTSLTLIHTAPALKDTFDDLLEELAPDINVRHVVHEDLLKDALDAGELTTDVRQRTAAAMLAEAESEPGVVLCTCSTVGPGADDARSQTDVPVLRVDRPMAEEAVRSGTQIVVCATLETTMVPTLDLLRETAQRLGREVNLIPVVFEAARAKFIEGDFDSYVRIIADGLHSAAEEADVIVLAQASMAPALALCGDIEVPMLTSPRSGLAAAVEVCRQRAAAT